MTKRLLLFFLFPLAHCSCPSGYDPAAAGECRTTSHSIVITPDDQALDTAITHCNTVPAHPVIIHNDEQQSHWLSRKPFTNVGLVLGLVCNANTLNWQWVDESAVDYKPYITGGYNPALDQSCNSGCVWYIDNDLFWQTSCGTISNPYDIYCTTEVHQPIPSGDGCESFEDDSDDGICYQVANAMQNWREAQTICRSFGADVASVHNTQENSFLRRLAVSVGAVNGMYLGAGVSGMGNRFAWMDGSPWDYENFYPGFPVRGAGECLIMDTGDTSGQWKNVDCSSNLAVACMRQRNYISPGCMSGSYKEGQIAYSPGYPFDASIPCDFLLNVEEGKNVELEVIVLEANTCCDHFIVYEDSIGSNIIANLTGEISNKFYTTTSSNSMRVSWQPNGGVNVKGVIFTFRSV